MMKKLIIPLICVTIFAGCTTEESNTKVVEIEDPIETIESVEDVDPVNSDIFSQMDPLSVILANHQFNVQGIQSTQITITPGITTVENSVLKVVIKEDGYKDDSIKGETRTLILEQQADESWEITANEITSTECYRGETDEGLCI